MSPVSVLPAAIALLIALGLCHVLSGFMDLPEKGRVTTIDGLRGYLAFLVFVHHAAVWYYFVRGGVWILPPSRVYLHFGQTSVAFFFMITGFLFYSKILNARKRPIDWSRLYLSRFLRLGPVYFVMLALLLLVVGILSQWRLHVSGPTFLAGVARWCSVAMIRMPALNGVAVTNRIIGGVTWTLQYEWYFYALLPVLALTSKATPPVPGLLLSVAAIVAVILTGADLRQFMWFGSGIVAALLVRSEAAKRVGQAPYAAVLCCGCIAGAVFGYPTAYSKVPYVLLTAAFFIVASGNSIGGLLTLRASRALGELTYSIYLLHGILLFVVFRLIIGVDRAREFTAAGHWEIVYLLVPVLVLATFLSFKYVEKPAMGSTDRIARCWRQKLRPDPSPLPMSPRAAGPEVEPAQR